jgi:hypothetical protein
MRTYDEMAYPDYVRERARQLRVEKKLSLDEIAEQYDALVQVPTFRDFVSL